MFPHSPLLFWLQVREIAAELFPVVHSAGLNEQELADLFEALGGAYDEHHIHRAGLTGQAPGSKDVPVPAMVERALRFVMGSSLLRVHFHCLAYHIVAERPGARRLFRADPAAALARGSVTATTQACDRSVAQLGPADVRLLAPAQFRTARGVAMRVSAESPTASWGGGGGDGDGGDVSFTLAPVLVCQKLVKSVGLGDAISAAGLAHSV